jgi:hypothetical protein
MGTAFARLRFVCGHSGARWGTDLGGAGAGQHVRQGEWLDLPAEGETVDKASMRSWGKSRTISATVIRDILRGRLAADPDPHGLRLQGPRISGRLDLESLSTDVNLELSDCLLEEGVLARDARMASVRLAGMPN